MVSQSNSQLSVEAVTGFDGGANHSFGRRAKTIHRNFRTVSAGLGVRVGWLFGPKDIIGKMTEILSHIGAWAPKPEQRALDTYIRGNHEDYLSHIKYVRNEYEYITQAICQKFEELKEKGFSVDCQRPEGGIYISVYLDYVKSFGSTEEYISFLINECGLGIVPFEYFGSKENKGYENIKHCRKIHR